MALFDEPPLRPLWQVISIFVIGWSSLLLAPLSFFAVAMMTGGGAHGWTPLERFCSWAPFFVTAAGILAFKSHYSSSQWPIYTMLITYGLFWTCSARPLGLV